MLLGVLLSKAERIIMEEKITLLKPKIDVVFHCLFKRGNERITKAIIEATTKEKIESINLDNDRYLMKNYPDEKLGIVDLKATLDNGTICDIEIQLADNHYTAERFLFYWSKIYSSQLVQGDDYGKLNKVIGIIILDYEIEKTKEIEELSTKWKITEVSTGKQIVLTDVLEFYINKNKLIGRVTNYLCLWYQSKYQKQGRY